MELTQNTSVFLTGNDAKFKISVTPLAGERNVKAINFLKFDNPFVFSQAPVNGQGLFRLYWPNGGTLLFYIAQNSNLPDRLPYLSDYDNNMSRYIAAVVEKLNKINAITKDFYIEIVGNQYIALKAYRAGNAYNIQYFADHYGNATHFQSGRIENFVSGDTQTNFNTRYLDLSILTDQAIRVRKNLISYADRNDLFAEVEISQFVHDTSNLTHVSYPEAAGMVVVQNGAKKQVRIVNEGSNITFNATQSTVLNKAFYGIPGTFSEMRESIMNAECQNLIQYLDSGSGGRRFLTFCQSPKQTDIYAPEKLYWLVPSAGDYRLYIRKYFKCIEKSTSLEPLSLKENDIVEIQCSYRKISAGEQFKIYAYEIWFVNASNNRVSEVFRFEVNRDYQRFARYFLFLNSFGMYECLRTAGKVTIEKRLKKSFVELDKATRISQQKKSIQLQADMDVSYKVETGLNYKFYNEWLQEFLISPDVRFLKDANAYKVVIEDAKIKDEDGEFLQSNSITISQLQYDNFSPDFVSDSPILPDFSADFNKDFNSFSWQDSGDYVPIANAGEDKETSTGSVVLNATALTDGFTGTWSKISGPGNPIFSNINAYNSEVSFNAEGNYILRWTVGSGVCTDFDDMVVVVTAIQELGITSHALNARSILLNGAVWGQNMVLDRGFVWSVNSNPTVDDNKLSAGNGNGAYSYELFDLDPDYPPGTYYFKPYAEIDINTFIYGEQIAVTIEINESPFVTISELGNIFRGNVSEQLGQPVIQKGFMWAPGPYTSDWKRLSPNETSSGYGIFELNRTDYTLAPSGTWTIRAFAKISDTEIYYSTPISFIVS